MNITQIAIALVSIALMALVVLVQKTLGSDAGIGIGFGILFYLVTTIGVRQSKNLGK
jgi:preprotein translocase subunit SecG